MLLAEDFRALARDALRGRWKYAVLASLIVSLFGASTTNGSVNINFKEEYRESAVWFFHSGVWRSFLAILIAAALIGGVYAIVRLIVCGPVTLGYARYNLKLVDHEEAEIGDLFSQFHRIKDSICLILLRAIKIFLWTLLLVIPGIIASYRYSMAFYIMAENPDITAGEALKASGEMMKGNKLRLFCLEFSFIGWNILCILPSVLLTLILIAVFRTTGINEISSLAVTALAYIPTWVASLFLGVYQEAARAAFYRDVSRGEAPTDPAQEPQPYEIIP